MPSYDVYDENDLFDIYIVMCRSSGAFICIQYPALVDLLGVKKIARSTGLLQVFIGAAGLIATPLAGQRLNQYSKTCLQGTPQYSQTCLQGTPQYHREPVMCPNMTGVRVPSSQVS